MLEIEIVSDWRPITSKRKIKSKDVISVGVKISSTLIKNCVMALTFPEKDAEGTAHTNTKHLNSGLTRSRIFGITLLPLIVRYFLLLLNSNVIRERLLSFIVLKITCKIKTKTKNLKTKSKKFLRLEVGW